MSQDDFCIGIQPVGEIASLWLKIAAGSFLGELRIKPLILPCLALPEYAYDRRRIQYDAGAIINRLETLDFNVCHAVIAMIDADLFIPVFSFVLGEARVDGKCALVSLYRLDNNPERMIKVAFHEFGHLMNLGHCHEPGCVMTFSTNIEQLDSISGMFCKYCLEKIRYRMMKKTMEL
ncbi:MAG: zinc metallopeptidase [Pseudomonadota bacterium]